MFVVGAVVAFMPVDKSAFTATQGRGACSIEYEFADNLNYREVERYVTKIEDWILARKDSLHVKSTYSYFTNNYAFTRAYLADGLRRRRGRGEGAQAAARAACPSSRA